MIEKKSLTRWMTFIAIGALFLLTLLMLRGIVISIMLGLVMAYVFFPIFKVIHKFVKEKNTATSILMFFILAIVAVPIWFMTPILIKQIFDTYLYIQQVNVVGILQQIFPNLLSPDVAKAFSANFNNILSKMFATLLNQFENFIIDLPQLALQFVVVLFTFYFATRDSDKLREYILNLSPFAPSTEKKFFEEFRNITNAVVYGQFLIGIVQGLLLGIGLYILGVDKVLLLTAIAIVCSMIPYIGAWVVWLPVSVYLITSGNLVDGVILFLYGTLIVSTIDNVMRIYFLSKSSSLSTIVCLIGIIGGLTTFGLVGLLLGPLILAYSLIIIEFYRQGKLDELFKE